jgi:hypothetical protein
MPFFFFLVKPIVHLFLVFMTVQWKLFLTIIIVMIINISPVRTYHVSRESFLSTILYGSSQLINYLLTILETILNQILESFSVELCMFHIWI